jgi:fatty-acid desaturase
MRKSKLDKLKEEKLKQYFALLSLLLAAIVGVALFFHYFFGFGFITVFVTAIYAIFYLFYITWMIWDPEDFE